jgi:MIP family channel proteins
MVSMVWGTDRSIRGFHKSVGFPIKVIDLKAVAAEFVGTFIMVAFGCGAATSHGWFDAETRLAVAFAFGMSIMVLSYAIGHHSGAHLNTSVTFSLVLGGHVPWYQGLANAIGQVAAGILGACLVAIMFPCQSDFSTTLGSNQIFNPAFDPLRVLVAEAFGTFLVCFTIWETAVTPQTSCGKNACLAIGFAYFVVHLMLLPIDGCSVNPARSFGPTMTAYARGCNNYIEGSMKDQWIFWIGPLLGAAAAAGVQKIFAPSMQRLTSLEEAEDEYIRAQQLLECPQETIEVSFDDGKDNFDGAKDVEQYPVAEKVSSSTFGRCLNIF